MEIISKAFHSGNEKRKKLFPDGTFPKPPPPPKEKKLLWKKSPECCIRHPSPASVQDSPQWEWNLDFLYDIFFGSEVLYMI